MRNARVGWFIILIVLVTETQVLADGIRHGVPGGCGSAFRIVEVTAAPALVTIHMTDVNGDVIPMMDRQVQTVAPGLGLGNAVSPAEDIAANPNICDAINDTTIGGVAGGPNPPVPGGNNGGVAAILRLESLVFDEIFDRVLIEGTFDRIAAKVGIGVPIRVPDLFADTNGNGALDDGDVLYSLVDINTYLDAAPSFSIGDTFNVVNGHVATLPDMIFSTTPFIYDPLLTTSVFGSVDVSGPPGFNGTPFTGTTTVLAVHEATTVPEPTTLLLLGSGLAGLMLWRKRTA